MPDLPCGLAIAGMRTDAPAAMQTMEVDLVNLLIAVGSFRRWSRLRAQRKAMWLATDELGRLPDAVLDDIGISRDEIACRAGSFPRSRRHHKMY
jgi:uncharacterized protein YjiS (DUF1127 family)